ncbi:biotin carboxyl carrier protein [Pseudonocardia thermophila]|uniref:Biotin carboxyl carrier protein of acetyl-CoA carboxylase n=1 Tax=Pseudonocardia thermophila TaxID=1848 RepID=A0A1M7AJ65_PSETH|nr:biotin/lipoyl-containing protein [Pseudonocardia thermophila]SHL42687.1 biotin carboxyl carrier protein [Pseudonocardia thermophila]
MSTIGEPPVPGSVLLREVQEILRTFRDSQWTGMTVNVHGMRIAVGKHGPPAGARPPAAEATPAATAVAEQPAPRTAEPAAQVPAQPTPPAPASGVELDLTGCVAATSPAVGAFWVAPAPGQPPFVQVGDVVEKDQQLAIVEVMKLMNPVLAPVAGTIVQVCAANSEFVEFDQPLFWIRPNDG